MAGVSSASSTPTVKPGELITFIPYSKSGSLLSNGAVKVQYNPSSIHYSESANYSEDTVPHGSQQSKGNTSWNSSNAARWSFTIFVSNFAIEGMLNQAMAIKNPTTDDTPVVVNKVKALKKLFLKINGDTHEPNDVQVSFGSIIFRGNCISFNTQYKDFNLAGDSTSAHIALEFIELLPKEELNAGNDLKSPDVTHSVSIGEGDHLTAVSAKMYGKASFFREIAMVNNLDSIRGIEPGTILYLPPLEKNKR